MLAIRITGKAQQVFDKVVLMVQLAGPKLTLGDIAQLVELSGKEEK